MRIGEYDIMITSSIYEDELAADTEKENGN